MSAGNTSETSWNLSLQYDLEIVFPPLFFTQHSKNHSIFPVQTQKMSRIEGDGAACVNSYQMSTIHEYDAE